MTIIFDLDGTLLNTIDDLGEACNHALSAFGYPMHRIEEYPRLVGNGINKLISRALPSEHRDEETVQRLRSVFVPYYDAHNCVYTRPYEGIVELLTTLKSAGHHLAVASNKYDAAAKQIVAHYFPGVFDVVYGEREGVERKPHPQIVHDILNELFPHTCEDGEEKVVLYVGDSLVDIETARNAGVPIIACTWGFVEEAPLSNAQPDYLVHTPLEIIKICNQC